MTITIAAAGNQSAVSDHEVALVKIDQTATLFAPIVRGKPRLTHDGLPILCRTRGQAKQFIAHVKGARTRTVPALLYHGAEVNLDGQRLKLEMSCPPAPGSLLYDREGLRFGIVRGFGHLCRQVEDCSGSQVPVLWRDLRLTWPCTESLVTRADGQLQIG